MDESEITIFSEHRLLESCKYFYRDIEEELKKYRVAVQKIWKLE